MKRWKKVLAAVMMAAAVMTAGCAAVSAAGADTYSMLPGYASYSVSVDSGYLALRNAKAYDAANEIGRLYTGDTVQVIDASDSQYWYVYAPKFGLYGYVNKDYLRGTAPASTPSSYGNYTVRVQSGYLALRNAKAYDAANEIGRLWTGDTVQVTDTSDSQYWYVYAPTLGKYGYVNKDYLYGTGTASSGNYGVRVDSGYLALRNAKAYDAANEIGRLYNGDSVQLIDASDSQYWYVYSPKHALYGYVNKDYIYALGNTAPAPRYYTVRVDSGYLALRNAKAYNAANEIGKLYTGESVQLVDATDSQYWYVYAPSLGKYGYVNKDYLR